MFTPANSGLHTYSFKPQGPTLDAYLRDRSQRSFICGPLGSGKTNASCWKAFKVMCNQEPNYLGERKTRLVAIRNTFGELLSTTAKDWLEMFEPLGRYVEGGREPPQHTIDFTLPPERPGDKPTRVMSEMIFLALDREEHVRKLRGMQLTAGMLSEVKELPFGVLGMLDLRIGRYPREGGQQPSWYGIFGDTNAPDTDHWYYRMAEEKRPEGWTFYRQPGGVMRVSRDAPWISNPDAENLPNLPRDYYVKGCQGKDEDWILVNLANEYGFVADGKPVYPDYRDSAMCRQFELVKELGIFIGLDFGLTPAALIGQQTFAGQWRYRHELVTEDTGILRFAGELNLFMQRHYMGWPINGIYGDPAGGQRQAGDVDERTVFQLLGSQDIHATPAPGNNDFVLRAEAFSAPMKRFIDGEPGMLIHPDCVVTRKGLQGGYAYKRIKVVGSDRWRDLPDKNRFSHPCFVAGTLISTVEQFDADARTAIEFVRIGDYLHAPGPRATGHTGLASRVVATGAREVAKGSLVTITVTAAFISVRDPDGPRVPKTWSLTCTLDHPFARGPKPGHGWINASDLKPGQYLCNEDPLARGTKVLTVERLPGPGVVYNLTVDKAKCYYAGGILVHNCEAGQYLNLGAGEGARIMQSTTHDRDLDVRGFRQKMGYAS